MKMIVKVLFALGGVFVVNVVVACKTEYNGSLAWHGRYVMYCTGL